MLWAAFDPVVDTSGIDPMSERPFDADHVERMLRALLLPPPDEREHRFLGRFFEERLPRFRFRFEYRLLLAAAGVRRIRLSDFTEKESARWIEEEWRQFRKDGFEANELGGAGRLARGGLWLGGPPRDQSRAHLSKRPHLQLRHGRARRVHGPRRIHVPAPENPGGLLRDDDHPGDHPQRAYRRRSGNGIAAGSITDSLPNDCGRCAASSCSASPRPTRRARKPIRSPRRWIELVRERDLASDGLPLRSDRQGCRGTDREAQSPTRRSSRRSAITSAMPR